MVLVMRRFSLTSLSDHELLRELATALSRVRAFTALVLAQLSEVDARKLYLPAAYPSMYAWCVGELHMSEDAAYKRIAAARAARAHPQILEAIEHGRLHLSGVLLLAPHLTSENAAELLAAATHKTKAQIETVIAERFPRPDVPASLRPVTVAAPIAPAATAAPAPCAITMPRLAPGRVGMTLPEHSRAADAREAIQLAAPPRVEPTAAPPTRVTPLAPQRYALQVTLDQAAHDNLRAAQALLGLDGRDVAAVLGRALELLRRDLERRKYAATSRPRETRQASRNPRQIASGIKRVVWARDQAQCTFVSDKARRCEARSGLEFDHITPVARGGEATVANLRLRCRAHNQFAADQVYGAGFMRAKREKGAARGSHERGHVHHVPAAKAASTAPEPA